VWLGLLASGAATVGGYLGGHLAFGEDSTESSEDQGAAGLDQPELFEVPPPAGAPATRSA
jgi:hypothetical protein